MSSKKSPASALVAYLNEVPDYLRSPIYPELLAAAANVDSAISVSVINNLMGAGRSVGCEVPTGPIQLPQDHRLHLECGTEWYWISCNLTVDGSNGLDRIGVLVVQTRNRAVSSDVQKAVGWTDAEAQVVDTAATVTVATRADNYIVRRNPNVQWAPLGGKVAFNATPFLYQNGPDSMKGSEQVLPLAVHVDDGSNMQINVTMTSDLPADKAFFLQGKDGITPEPTPGIYYSWPQLAVTGSVSVGGKTYKVSGTGWIDHQLMMGDTNKPAPPAPPLPMPGWKPLQGFNGWSWCQFNLDNGDAITGAGFQVGTLKANVPVQYAWYLQRTETGWLPIYVMGMLALDRFIPVLNEVVMPTAWTYQLTDVMGGKLVDVGIMAVPWYPDGSFQTGDLGVPGETPVNVALVQRAPQNAQTGAGLALTGTGYCECVGYEPPERYVERALLYLEEHCKS